MYRWIFIIIALLGVIGIGDSWLIYERASGGVYLPCVVGEGCDKVLSSPYSSFWGISLAWWGFAFYLGLFLSSLLAYFWPRFRKALAVWAGIGLIFSLYLFALQAFVIKAFCDYCLISFVNVFFASVLLGMYVWKQRKGVNVV